MRTVIKGLTSEIIPNNFESINHPGGVSVVTNKPALSDDFGLDSFRRPKTGLKSSGTIESEMAEYYHDETCDELLQHWKVYDKKYPRLARLVRRLLSVPANSSKFPLSFSDRDWADWQENAAVVSLAFLRHHKSHLPGLKTPTGMASKSGLLRI
jgi:hAT family C-terminal dimerisation region